MTANATGNDEILVNGTTTGGQFNVAITTLVDGGWLEVWTSDASGEELTFFQRYAADGSARGGETAISADSTIFGQQKPSVTGLSDGGWVIAWDDASAGGENNDGVFLQRYAADGTTDGTITQMSLSATPVDADPILSGLADGGWIATWRDDLEILQQRFDASGHEIGDAEAVNNTFTNSTDKAPSVSALADGGWLVTWHAFATNPDVFQQHFGADGSAIGEATLVNTTTSGAQQDSAVAALADGGWVVTWESGTGQDGDNFGVFQQRFDGDGNKIGTETQVNSFTAGNQSDPSIAALADGGWIVTWESSGQDGDDEGVYLQRYDREGNTVGSETQVNVTTVGSQGDPVATALPDGGWVVSWESGDADGKGVFQRVFATDVLGTGHGDTLAGTSFDETLRGFAGNDKLNGGGGNDLLQGGFGNDTYIVNSAGDEIQEFAAQGKDTVKASISCDLGGSIENLVLTGSSNLRGTGNALANSIAGNSGDNRLDGGAGNDRLEGGAGADKLFGGKGADIFVFTAQTDSTKAADGRDRIVDFSHAQNDTVSLSSIDAKTTRDGNQAFSFIGEASFSHHAGELHYTHSDGHTFVQGDTNGDGKADFAIRFDAVIDFVKSDFIL